MSALLYQLDKGGWMRQSIRTDHDTAAKSQHGIAQAPVPTSQ